MKYYKQSLSYIIELTVAYKNEVITKAEYRELRAYELAFAAFEIRELIKDNATDIITYGFMYSSTLLQCSFMLAQPKPPKFPIGGTTHGKEEVILPNYNKL